MRGSGFFAGVGYRLKKFFEPIDLTKGSCWRVIVTFTLPIVVSYVLQQLYVLSDAAICGQNLSADEVAGVNDTSSLVFIFMQFAFGCTAGFCVIRVRVPVWSPLPLVVTEPETVTSETSAPPALLPTTASLNVVSPGSRLPRISTVVISQKFVK